MWGIGLFESLFPIFFLLFFGVAIYMIVSTLAARARENRRNDASPRLTVPATVVSKRTNVSHHHTGSAAGQYHTSTTYYATFQVESGDRMELQLAGNEYGLLVEGDKGKLSFQGTRFLGFERS